MNLRYLLSFLALAGIAAAAYFLPDIDAGTMVMAAVPAAFTLPNGRQIEGMSIQTQKRAEWDFINRSNEAMGIDGIVPMPGYLRAEYLLGSQGNFAFNVNANQQANNQTIFATEQRLNQNDAFYITEMGVLFYRYATNVANDRGKAVLQSFANPAAIGATGGFGTTNAPLLEAIYNGYTSFRVNDRVMIPAINNNRFKLVGAAQQGLAVSTAAADNKMGGSQWQDGAGLATVDIPLVQLNGQANNIFQVTIPTNVDLGTVSNEGVVAVLLLQGWLCQNAGAARVAQG